MKISVKYFIAIIALLITVGSCTSDFEDMNTNPNKPTDVSPQYLLPQALQTSIDNYWGNKNRNERINFDHAMSWIGHLTRNIYENEGDNYNVQPSVNIKNWEVFYADALINFQKIIETSGPDAKSPNPNYEGIGIGMRAWGFSLLTDIWGAIPYTSALSGTADEPVYSPTYDSQEIIYAGIIEDLRVANEKLDPAGPAIKGDIMFGGKVLLWKKFFNSLRFKLLNRQAHLVSSSSAEMQTMLDDPNTYPMIDNKLEIAQLKYGAVPTNNPWNDILIQQGRTDWNISSTLVEKLKELSDPRLSVYAAPGNLAGGVISGHANGLPGEIATKYLGYSAVINPTVFAQTTSPAVLMSHAELLFTKAEAALDGNISGDAQAFLDAGIVAAFDQYGLTVPDGYIAQLGSVSKEIIMTQKWIALFGQGIEAWTEYRRTGYPVMPAADPQAKFQNDGVLPTRLVYPSTEYSLNGVQVKEAEALNAGLDNMKTKMWWVEN
ncbi:MAG TPA: SusD/RagB family nutrient-binding outer membrane lipoprotein [Chryseolinea sp.]|nr:SusD/RagB family nutrient-binding outer membrane lipoprotein [Chryseolinea sp.]